MRNRTSIIALFVLLTFSLSGQEGDSTSNPYSAFGWNLQMYSGVRIKDHSSLSNLIYGDASRLNTAYYRNGGLNITMQLKRYQIIIMVHRAVFNDKINPNEELEVRESYAFVNFGYDFLGSDKFQLVPSLGIGGISGGSIIYTNSTATSTNTQNYFNTDGDTYRLKTERWYGRIGLQATYYMDIGNGALMFPLDIGIDLEYLEAISPMEWKSGLDNSMEGPDIFRNSFYAGFVMGWRL